jgi:hypothetical protein
LRRHAAWALLLLIPLLFATTPARADHGGFHQGGRPGTFMRHDGHMFFHPGGRVFFRHDGRMFFDHDRRFDRDRRFFDRDRDFRRHAFFRPFFFFGTSIIAPLPIVLFPPPAPPAYLMGPVDGYPSCYDYQMSGMYGGEPPYGAACVGPDGSWQVVPGY